MYKQAGISVVLLSTIFSTLMAQGDQFQVSVPVTRSVPVYNTISEQVPYEYCYDHKEPIMQDGRNNILGALIGGALGTQVGKGRGKDAAIVAGALLGSGARDEKAILSGLAGGAAGSQVGGGRGQRAATIAGTVIGTQMGTSRQETGQYRVERRCETRFNTVNRQVLSGYSLYGSFMGRDLIRFSPSQMAEFPIHVSISY